MKYCYIFLLCVGLSYGQEAVGDDHYVKKNAYPYMAFMYYMDPSVVDASGQRFLRSAVLVRADVLLSSALGATLMDADGFPKKTLLARAGARAIDANFTLNEDEDEQEREVIKIVRPYNHSATQWWTTDISLLKTLLPFNMTAAVGIKPINFNSVSDPKTCIILVYAKKPNSTDEKALTQLFVEMLTPGRDTCGAHYATGLACAGDSVSNREAIYDPDHYCQGNSGGPLVCSGDVLGLQTYVDGDCGPPHLYQLLAAWDSFLTCAVEDECREERCANLCDVTYKDAPPAGTTPTTPTSAAQDDLPQTPATVATEPEDTTTATSTTTTSTTVAPTPTAEADWPKERDDRKQPSEAAEEGARTPAVAAHQHRRKARSAAEGHLCVLQTLLFGLVLALF